MKKSMFTLLSLSCISLLFACQPVSKPIDNSEAQTILIGDNSKVIEVASSLPYPEGLAYDSIAIQSDTEPYELTVFVSGKTDDTTGLQEAANQAFEKISNLGVVHFQEKDSGQLLETYTRNEPS
ncbi:DUF4825 domain-containing protein [Streptococcus cameli]